MQPLYDLTHLCFHLWRKGSSAKREGHLQQVDECRKEKKTGLFNQACVYWMIFSCSALRMPIKLVSQSLWPRLKYPNYRTDCHEISWPLEKLGIPWFFISCHQQVKIFIHNIPHIHVLQRVNPNGFGGPLTVASCSAKYSKFTYLHDITRVRLCSNITCLYDVLSDYVHNLVFTVVTHGHTLRRSEMPAIIREGVDAVLFKAGEQDFHI